MQHVHSTRFEYLKAHEDVYRDTVSDMIMPNSTAARYGSDLNCKFIRVPPVDPIGTPPSR